MSRENVELVVQSVDNYNRRDIEGMLSTFHPDAEWYPLSAQAEGNQAYHGREGLRQWWANQEATFHTLQLTLHEVRDLGDSILALGHLNTQSKSGVRLDTDVGWLLRFRDGLATSGRVYSSHAKALEAAGLSE
jgi:ketosteroid isomerase-like protein